MWWSYSTHRTMRLCQRKLVYEQKIASPIANDPVRRDAFLLRQLQTLPEWHGSLVHHTLANVLVPRLRDRLPFSAEDLSRNAIGLAARQWDFSARRRFREPGMVKTAQGEEYCALDVHEDSSLSASRDEALCAAEAFVRHCFQSLMEQGELLSMLQRGSGFIAEHQLTFPLNGATIRAIPDLVCRQPNGGLLIVDWKTVSSETDDYAMQLYLYALAALQSERWADVKRDAVALREVNLFQGVVRNYDVTSACLVATEDFAYVSIREMTTLLAGLSKYDFQIEDYEVAEKATTCALCAFRAQCREGREQEAVRTFSTKREAGESARRNCKTKHEQVGIFAAAVPTSAPLLDLEEVSR